MDQHPNDRVEVYVDSKGEHRWRYVAEGNHAPLAGPEEGYTHKSEMMSAIARVTNRVPVVVETKDAPMPGPGTIRVVKGVRDRSDRG